MPAGGKGHSKGLTPSGHWRIPEESFETPLPWEQMELESAPFSNVA